VSFQSSLLDWLTAPLNYDKWKWRSSHLGAPKKRLASEILLAIQEQGCCKKMSLQDSSHSIKMKKASD